MATNADAPPRSEPLAVLASPTSFAVDNAFQRACANGGVSPQDLLGRPLDAFRSPGLPDDVAARRFSHFQNSRIRKLYLVAAERQRILSSEERREKVSPVRRRESALSPAASTHGDTSALIPHPPSTAPTDTSGTGRGPAAEERPLDESDMMVQRALHQRQFWDDMNHRVQRGRRRADEERQKNAERAKAAADEARRKQEAEEEQRRALQAINQQQMRKRWERDDRLAVIRQARLDAEFDSRMKQHAAHMAEVSSAREARMRNLMEKARTGSPHDTHHRLQKAKTRKEVEDEACRAKGEQAVQRVAERRKRHAVERFVQHARLSERALRERKHANEVIRRSRHLLRARLQQTLEYMENEELRGLAVLEQQEELKQQKIQSLIARREDNHGQARVTRELQSAEAEDERRREEAEKAAQADARERRQRLESALKDADAEARQEHREFVLQRVVRLTEVRQAEAMRKHERMQRHAENRMQKLREIRSLLSR